MTELAKRKSTGKPMLITSIAAFLLLVGTIALFKTTARVTADPDTGCERTTLARLPSPDGMWIAMIYEDVCKAGQTSTAGVTNRVQLMRQDAPTKPDADILKLDNGRRGASRPALVWLTERKLQITAPNKSVFAVNKSQYENVDIVLKFDPDDPDERESFLRDLGLKSSL